MDGKQSLVELVILSTGDEVLAMVRRESCLRKKQDGVSVERRADGGAHASWCSFSQQCGRQPPHWDCEVWDSADGSGSLE